MEESVQTKKRKKIQKEYKKELDIEEEEREKKVVVKAKIEN